VTGGAGFIGSAVARMLATSGETVVVLDKLTYAADLRRLDAIKDSGRLFFEKTDICDGATVADIIARYAPAAILHLAAESHVDRSITGPAAFIHSNIVGTYEPARLTIGSSLAMRRVNGSASYTYPPTRCTERLVLSECSRSRRRSRQIHHTPPARPQPITSRAPGTGPTDCR